jgi:hypothetical protein
MDEILIADYRFEMNSNCNPKHGSNYVSYALNNAQDLCIEEILERFSEFLTACGFERYTFEVKGS